MTHRQKRYRIIVLGAGFSRAAGLPLGVDLWKEILDRAKSLSGRASKFFDDIKSYLEYKRDCEGIEITEKEINFEDFLSVLDIEHFLRLRGSDTWSKDGNEGTVVVKTLIGEILTLLTPQTKEIPELYLEFARRLQPDDLVLTFNYDVLLEAALDAIGKPYRLFPTRYESIGEHSGIGDDSKEEVVILKLHGSIDWFDREQYDNMEEERRAVGLTTPREHPIFNSPKNLGLTKVLDGPRFEDDPLKNMYRVKDIWQIKHLDHLFSVTPWMLSPSTYKILNASKIKDFWSGLGKAGLYNLSLAIIGYSLPPQDNYAKQAIYTLVTNFQQFNPEIPGRTKSPLVIVDHCKTQNQLAEFKKHYRFVDWDKTILHTEGFNLKSLDSIFS